MLVPRATLQNLKLIDRNVYSLVEPTNSRSQCGGLQMDHPSSLKALLLARASTDDLRSVQVNQFTASLLVQLSP